MPTAANEQSVKQANEEERQRLAEDELDGTDGRDHDLLERADLALADNGKGRERNDQQSRQAADDAGNEEPAAAQIGVVPRTLLKLRPRESAR